MRGNKRESKDRVRMRAGEGSERRKMRKSEMEE